MSMDQAFGSEHPHAHAHPPERQPSRYLVVIDAAESPVARLFLDTREPAGQFDAGTEEVVQMMAGRSPSIGACGAEWDAALRGHTAEERARAEVYTLNP